MSRKTSSFNGGHRLHVYARRCTSPRLPISSFSWTNNEFEEPEVYEYQRYIFGAKDSPTCAIYALQQTAPDHKTDFLAASEAVFEDFYMDDFIKSVNDVEVALTMQRNMRQLLLKGSFKLTKWFSNEITFCQ